MSLKRPQIIVQNLPQGLSLREDIQKSRVPRKPKHSFNIVQRPYEITPFFIAPVLAGETLRNLLLQARCVSTTLENRLIGHHLEHYFFYVKLRDLSDATDIVAMLMDNGTSVNTASGDSAYHYVKSGAADWVSMCLNKVVSAYFRDEGDTGSHVGPVTGLPLAQWYNYQSIFESLISDASLETDTIADTIELPEYEKEYATWQFLRDMQMTEASFEDYLGTFGVRVDDEAEDRPELVRFVKNWTYPTNTLDGDGTINTQASWSVMERADKDRFLKEPGFLFGVTIARPKLYNATQHQASVSMMNDALSWLPAVMKHNPHTSMKQFQGNSAASPLTAASTPAGGQLDADELYWLDVRDLFIYGDQFVNRTQGADVNNAIGAEDHTTYHGKKYPRAADLQGLGVGDVLTYETDGVVTLNILGTQMDVT